MSVWTAYGSRHASVWVVVSVTLCLAVSVSAALSGSPARSAVVDRGRVQAAWNRTADFLGEALAERDQGRALEAMLFDVVAEVDARHRAFVWARTAFPI